MPTLTSSGSTPIPSLLYIQAFLLVCQLELKFPQKHAHELVNVCRRHGLADTMASAEAKMQDVVIGTPDFMVMMKCVTTTAAEV